MAGAANSEIRTSYVKESAAGADLSAGAQFVLTSFESVNITANPRITENRSLSHGGQRFSISRNGVSVAGSASGPMIYGNYDDFFESLFQGEWSSNVLKNGVDQKTLAIESRSPQGAGADRFTYLGYKGIECSGGTIELTAGSSATVSFEMIGVGSTDAQKAASGGTAATANAAARLAAWGSAPNAAYTSPPETESIGSGSDIGTITMSGLGELDCMRSLSISFAQEGREEQPRLSSDDLCGISRGAMLPVLTGEFYVEDNFAAIYNAARNGTEFSMTIPIGKETTKKYSLVFPNCEFAEAPLVTSDTGPAFQNFRILPKYDATQQASVVLTRAVV